MIRYKKQLDIFLEINSIPETSPSLTWEAMKAYAWGQIISYSAGVNRQRRKKLEELSLEILQLDSTYANFFRSRNLQEETQISNWL